MPSKYGINIELQNASSKDISVSSSRPFALVGDDSTLSGLYLCNSVEEALAKVSEGSLKNSLEDLKASGLKSQIILSSFVKTEEDRTHQDNKNKALEAIEELKKVPQLLKAKPKFIACTEYNDAGIWEKLKLVSDYLRAVYAIELNDKTESAINSTLESIQCKRAIISFQKVKRLDDIVRPASVFLLSSYAKVMAKSEYGFAQTYSNKPIDGVISLVDSVEFVWGEDCEADRLKGKGVTTLFVQDGIRAWGGETRDSEFSSLHTMVIFDEAIECIFRSQKDAIDKGIKDVIGTVCDELRAFYRKLVGNGVALGYEVILPAEHNTNELLSEGKVTIIHKVQEMPLLKTLNNKLYRVSEWSQELIKEL